jgi:prephenate dehydratase
MSIAYQGQPGAFGHEACLKFMPAHVPLPRPSFRAVTEAVSYGEADFGMLPMENSCAGPVAEVQDLLSSIDLPVLSTHSLPVRMHLLAPPGTRLDSIRRVVSHKVALAQCADTLRGLGVTTETASNTAVAAKTVAESSDGETAVLASEAAAAIYGLNIIRRDIHDQPDNATTFVVLGRPCS